MIIGNIVGSNVFNVLGVLGITGIVRATDIETDALWRDFPVMFTLTLLLWLFAITRKRFAHIEGGALLLIYLGYVCYLLVSTVG